MKKLSCLTSAKQTSSSSLLKPDRCLYSSDANEHKEDIINNNIISLTESKAVGWGWGGGHHDLHFWLCALPFTRWLT